MLHFADVTNRDDFIDTIVQNVDRRHFESAVCIRAQRSNIADPVDREGTRRWSLGSESRADVPRAVCKLVDIIRAWRPHILHTHHYEPAVIGWLATRVCRDTRLVIGRHYSDAHYRNRSETKMRLAIGLEQLANRAATRIIVPSSYVFDLLTNRQHIAAEKIDVVHYGFRADRFVAPPPAELESSRRALKSEERVVLGTFGRLHEEKGHRFLIEAIRQLQKRIPQILLLIVGSGEGGAAIEQQIGASGVGSMVRLLGVRDDVLKLMTLVDLVVQPTLHEAFSQVMAESLWMGRPLIITDVSGALDVIEDGKTGILVPRGDSRALASAIERLVADPSLRAEIGRAGRRFAEEHLSIESVIPRYERCYRRVMET